MKIFERCRRAARLYLLRHNRILRDEILECDSPGRIRHLLWKFEGIDVRRIQVESGGWRDTVCRVFLSDGYDFFASHFWERDCLKEMALKLYAHAGREIRKR